MMKFKSLFRKGHGGNSSTSAPNNSSANTVGIKHSRNTNVLKVNHFASAAVVAPNNNDFHKISPAAATTTTTNTIATPVSTVLTNSNSSSSLDRNTNGKQGIQEERNEIPTRSNNSSNADNNDEHFEVADNRRHSTADIKNMELDNVLRQLEAAVKDKFNLEKTLQDLIHTHGELETLRKEVDSLKEQREEVQKSLILKLGQVNLTGNENGAVRKCRLPNSAPASIAPHLSSESTEMLDSHEWDKHSSSSLSEVSVACLQDRIMQMEETHYSTSEELQATLQELTDLQTQLTELQSDNERLGEEKDVLLESLCRQTEKLEDARTKVDTLQGLLLDFNKTDHSFSDREHKIIDLLKDSQHEREVSIMKQKDLVNELQESNRHLESCKKECSSLQDRICSLSSLLDTANEERTKLEDELILAKEQSSSKNIEIKRLTTLLENARAKIEEIESEREKQGDKSELEEIIGTLRKEKDHLETEVTTLQEQSSRSNCEVTRLREQLINAQEECKNVKNNSKLISEDLERKYVNSREEVTKLTTDLQLSNETNSELQNQLQCHIDDKRQLKAVLLETQRHLSEYDKQNLELRQCIEDERKLREKESLEWEQFQSDLLMTVRVANDIKTEAQIELERLVLENKQLRDKIISLETEVDKLKKLEKNSSPLLQRSISNETGVSLFSSVMNQEISNRRNNYKMSRQDSKLSVKSLIESIENATKQVKNGPGGSRCSSTSSLNSLASPSLLSGPTSLCDMEMKTQVPNCTKSDSVYDSSYAVVGKLNDELSLPPTSILTASKTIDFIHRSNSGDLCERKDPLQALVKNGGSKRNALLKWCQNKTVGYSNIDITNFSSSWNDGLALCAILHSYLPDKIPYDTLNQADKKRNFSVAFAAAESVGIKTTLNLNDMIQQERPDWNQVMAYVTSIFRHFEA